MWQRFCNWLANLVCNHGQAQGTNWNTLGPLTFVIWDNEHDLWLGPVRLYVWIF